MNMHHAGVPLGHQTFSLWNFQDFNVSFYQVSCWSRIFSITEYIAFLNMIIFGHIDFYLNIFTWTSIHDYLLLSIEELNDLSMLTCGCNG